MTRQKKEVLKKIQEMDREIAADRELSFGECFAFDEQLVEFDRIYNELWEELARISHYGSVQEMLNDERMLTDTVR